MNFVQAQLDDAERNRRYIKGRAIIIHIDYIIIINIDDSDCRDFYLLVEK